MKPADRSVGHVHSVTKRNTQKCAHIDMHMLTHLHNAVHDSFARQPC
jgi:hypothetical protein